MSFMCAMLVAGQFNVPVAARCEDRRCLEIRGVDEGAILTMIPNYFASLPQNKWVSFNKSEPLLFCLGAK